MPLTHAELASVIGANRGSPNKNLGDFRAYGWIQIENSAITILDPAALRTEASR